jgi:hypothetical protein
MKLVFRKDCECSDSDAAYLPTPRFVAHAPTRRTRQASVDLGFKCSVCGKEWRGGLEVQDLDSAPFPKLKPFLKGLRG